MATILVTGANGFIGRHLVYALAEAGHTVRGTFHLSPPPLPDPLPQGGEGTKNFSPRPLAGEGSGERAENSRGQSKNSITGTDGHRDVAGIFTLTPDLHSPAQAGEGSGEREWIKLDLSSEEINSDLFRDVDAVVHLAAHVHVGGLRRVFPDSGYGAVNRDGTRRLATMAARAGVRRFVFLSSIGVNGFTTGTDPMRRFMEDDTPRPANAYSLSKLEGEQVLREACAGTAMDWVILRAPMVFGPGNGGNFIRLMNALRAGVPLPVAREPVFRSVVYVENLVEVIRRCLEEGAAANQLFLLADFDVAVVDLFRQLAGAMTCRGRLVACPSWLLRLGRAMPLLGPPLRSLSLPLRVDSSHLRKVLNWQPGIMLPDALSATAAWYLASRRPVA